MRAKWAFHQLGRYCEARQGLRLVIQTHASGTTEYVDAAEKIADIKVKIIRAAREYRLAKREMGQESSDVDNILGKE